jgi:hypothetical protein
MNEDRENKVIINSGSILIDSEKKLRELNEITCTKEDSMSAIETNINPSHYQKYIEEMQWLEAMSRIPTLKKPERFKAALELQVRKYLDRNGQKDSELQELLKALWYMKALVAYVANDGQPLNVADIDKILSEV